MNRQEKEELRRVENSKLDMAKHVAIFVDEDCPGAVRSKSGYSTEKFVKIYARDRLRKEDLERIDRHGGHRYVTAIVPTQSGEGECELFIAQCHGFISSSRSFEELREAKLRIFAKHGVPDDGLIFSEVTTVATAGEHAGHNVVVGWECWNDVMTSHCDDCERDYYARR